MYIIILLMWLFKLSNSLLDYDDYIIENYRIPIRKRDMIVKSSLCQYYNYLPICSETILYSHPNKKRITPYNNFGLNDISKSYHRRNTLNNFQNIKHNPKYICKCNCPYHSFKKYKHDFQRKNRSPRHYQRFKNFWKNRNNYERMFNTSTRSVLDYNNINFLSHNPPKRENFEDTIRLCNEFLFEANANLETVYNKNTIVQWNYESNITDYNKHMAIGADEMFARELKENWNNVRKFDKTFLCSTINGTINRQFNILSKLGETALSASDYTELQIIQRNMESVFSKATINGFENEKKILHLEPDIYYIMGHSNNTHELRYIWEAWRRNTGQKMKDSYHTYVHLLNKAAKLNGYANAAELWLSTYDDANIEQTIEQAWEDIQPFYLQFHAFVRRKLKLIHKGLIKSDGLIPAHLLGNIFGQTWINLYNLTAPYPKYNLPDITAGLQSKGFTPETMFKEAEHFFTSLNLSEMTEEFWKNSIIQQRENVEMVCHASAWDMYDKKDFRIKMCTQVSYEDFIIIHHEMGHIEYYMAYKDLPFVYREGANPGFHEAIGDTIALSVSTPVHLKSLGLLGDDLEENSVEKDLNYLFLMALQKVAFLPYALVVDMWRWDVFRGKIRKENYNKHWWDLKRKYQGIRPPEKRTDEIYFDPGAKYHVAAGVPYIRYFISFIIQFQFHESLCKSAGRLDNENPLYKCDIYHSQEAGELLKKMLALGQSKPWPEVMNILTDNNDINAKSLLLYFKPLEEFLKYENEKSDIKIGWDY